MPVNNQKSIEDSLVDLYLKLKIRQEENFPSKEDHQIEKNNLKKINPITIIDYIISTIDILINLKVEERFMKEKKTLSESENNFNSSLALIVNNNYYKHNLAYENIIKELETQLRKMIKTEQYLKIQLCSLQSKYEHLEKKYEEMKINESKLFSSCASNQCGHSNWNGNGNGNGSVYLRKNIINGNRSKSPVSYNFNNQILIYGDYKNNDNLKNDEDIVNVSKIFNI